MIDWQWCRFVQLTAVQLYSVLAAREAVFVVEQQCPYQDADGLDQQCWHLIGWQGEKLAAYLRVVDPGIKYAEPSIGRVLTALHWRGTGVGKQLLREGLRRVALEYPQCSLRISAQQYLERFYTAFDFCTVSEPYDEDGIPHVEMLRPCK